MFTAVVSLNQPQAKVEFKKSKHVACVSVSTAGSMSVREFGLRSVQIFVCGVRRTR
jgi:hypothetical protein